MVPMLIVNAVLPPFIASLYREGRLAELEQVIRVAAAAGCVPMACVLMVFAFAAAPILELIYGPFYRDGAAALILVSTGQFINGLAGASAVVLMMTGHQFAMMCISVFCGLLLVIGGLAMVETQGMTGVAAATGLSVALHGVLSLLWVKHKTGMWTFCGGLGSIRHVRATLSTGT
jgi:O-antigen/teichoic acid export membrane protein